MQRVTDDFKSKYRRKGLATSSSTWPPFHVQSFTSLALVHQKVTQLQAKEDTTKIARVRTTGDLHKIPELTSSIKLDNINQIFTPITSDDQAQCPMSILIEGHPGIGKTTLVKEMCLQWANNQLLTSDKLVLLLMLRDPNVQKITSTEQLVRYTQSTDQVQYVLSYLQNTSGVGVTLIIDGFDELSTELRQTSFFRKVIEGDVLHNVRVVVTSRPSASACLHQCVQRRIEVLGFEKSSKEQYIDNALKDTPERLHKLKTHFQQYPNIDALCYIPLNMAIIVYLCLLGSLPPTATKMYESFIINTIRHHLKKVGKIPNTASITQIEKLPQLVCESILQLQKVAFDGILRDKIVFTVKELPVLCKDDPTCYGLLQSTECYSAEEDIPTPSFNFLHLGIQEFLAAKHVTALPEDEVYTLLKTSFVTRRNIFADPNSNSVRLSNMWILYCGITSGQCKTLRHYLTTYGNPCNADLTLHSNPHNQQIGPTLSHPSTTSIMSQRFDPLQLSSINSSYHLVTPPTQPVYSRYPLTPSRGQDITSYPQPYHLPTVYHPYQQQQLVQYPYHQPSNVAHDHTRSHDPISHPVKMYTPNMTHSHRLHDQMTTPLLQPNHMIHNASDDINPSMVLTDRSHDHTMTSSAERCFTTSASKQFNSNIDSQVTSEKITSPSQQGSTSDLRISNTITISQRVLKDPVKVLYLFQCFQEAQDNELCEVLSKSFSSNEVDISGYRLLPHHVVSLGFFLSRSHRKWKILSLEGCNIGDHGMSIIHQYLCGDKTTKQEITQINLGFNDLTGASSHLIADIISHLQPHTLRLYHNKITIVRDIYTAVIDASTIKMLDMSSNGLTAQDAAAISDMMICLEKLDISHNELGDHGVELLSEGIRHTKTLRVLNIEGNSITSSGTIAIANALTDNSSVEELYMGGISIGQDEAIALGNAITNNKIIKTLSLDDEDDHSDGTMDKESAMIIINSIYCNNTIAKLTLPSIKLSENDVRVITEEVEIVNSMRTLSNDQMIDFDLELLDLEENYFASYNTEHGIHF